MLVEIEYADGRVEDFDTDSPETGFVLNSLRHKLRVKGVAEIIGDAIERRRFFDRGIQAGPKEMVALDSGYALQYAKHVQDLVDIPFDGYLTELSAWETRYSSTAQIVDSSVDIRGQVDLLLGCPSRGAEPRNSSEKVLRINAEGHASTTAADDAEERSNNSRPNPSADETGREIE